jgi:hypothetical protein
VKLLPWLPTWSNRGLKKRSMDIDLLSQGLLVLAIGRLRRKKIVSIPTGSAEYTHVYIKIYQDISWSIMSFGLQVSLDVYIKARISLETRGVGMIFIVIFGRYLYHDVVHNTS